MRQLDQRIEWAKKDRNYILQKKLKQKSDSKNLHDSNNQQYAFTTSGNRRKQRFIDARSQYVAANLIRDLEPKMRGKKLNVFCVSNKTYRKSSDQGNVDMVNASGIPRLRRFCRSILDESRLLETKKFLETDLSSLLRSTELWANSTLDSEQDKISPLSFLENAEFKVWRVIPNLPVLCDDLLFNVFPPPPPPPHN
ncbi:hypothetical protein EIK77_004404 [Talaromyces pinophilus]|nr:hypothetical protein EIK77_004404 [Talaromyces pinophilus]